MQICLQCLNACCKQHKTNKMGLYKLEIFPPRTCVCVCVYIIVHLQYVVQSKTNDVVYKGFTLQFNSIQI